MDLYSIVLLVLTQGFSRIKLGYILGDITRVLPHTSIIVISLCVSKMNSSRISMITKSHPSFVYPIWKKEGPIWELHCFWCESKLSNKRNAFMGHVSCEGSFREYEIYGIFLIAAKMLNCHITRKNLSTCQFAVYISSSALFNALYLHDWSQVKILNNDHEG